ncbi:hypothetical protein GMDG_04786 [Pseudogymnoascus destructans 20631-21]|uniref:Uncharacterized protein n=1 Tax=Pseudogymnoascus destructans (strain ATCC MYA-4855 / 20631-21) TaxID=658429 RepID=L8GCT7_PSED2|nr:hypothetical protein GMDG_04786 [Pseudogymnoascus destructans 20631-21]
MPRAKRPHSQTLGHKRKTAVPQDPSKAKKPAVTKRKRGELPGPILPSGKKRKGRSTKATTCPSQIPLREQSGEIICPLPESPPKKSKRDQGIICAIPTSWAINRRERRAKREEELRDKA